MSDGIEVSRRQFLKLGGVVAGVGIAAASMVAISAPDQGEDVTAALPQRQEMNQDMVEALQVRQINVASYLTKVSEEV